jgi:hypothetical protein
MHRDEPWPPSLLSVYLERCAVALGLNPELHVAVHRSQPDEAGKPEGGQAEGARAEGGRAEGAPQAVKPAALVPQPSPSPDRQPPPEPAGSPSTCTVQGSGPLEKFTLSVRAPEGAACGWEAAVPGPADGPEPGPGLADIEDQLRSGWDEPTALFGARLRAIAACLATAGASAASPVVADVADDDGWLLLRVSGASMACTVVEITGVPCAVAIAIMTQDAVPAGQPGKHARRPGAAEAGAGGRGGLGSSGGPGGPGTGGEANRGPARRTATRGRTVIRS